MSSNLPSDFAGNEEAEKIQEKWNLEHQPPVINTTEEII